MSKGFESPQVVAGGDIRPARFVKPSTAADNTVLEADANEMTIGISGDSSRDAPVDGAETDHATSGDHCHVNPPGVVTILEIGSGGVTRGALIKSDADGKGVLAATTGTTLQWVGAMAIESASEGEFAKVLVLPPTPYRPAIA